MAAKRMILIDGNSLIYRAFFALRPLANSSGQSTQAVYGFTNMLLKLIDDESPDYIAVAMDVGKTTFRNSEYEAYKATRQETPEDLRSQMPIIRQFLEYMNITVLEKEDYEADDIIGTVSLLGEQAGLHSLIVTGDRDALQLASDDTHILLTRKGISDMERFTTGTIEEKFGINPKQLIDVKGLMGDVSDNIPGVPGIGEKTALKLIREYDSIDGVLSHLDYIGGKKLQENLQDYAAQALLSKKLATIIRDVPVDVDLEALKIREPDYDAIAALFQKLEFRNLTARIQRRSGNHQSIPKEESIDVETADFSTIINWRESKKAAAIYGYEDSLYLSDGVQILKWQMKESNEAETRLLKEWAEDEEAPKYTWEMKRIFKHLAERKIILKGIVFDAEIAAYLLDPGKNRYLLPELAREFGLDVLSRESPRLVETVYYLAAPMLEKLREYDQIPLLQEMEIPLAGILAGMEMAGIAIDEAQLIQMGQDLDLKIDSLAQEIYLQAGEEFNINSPKQLGEILFEKLKLPVGRKTKTGYSTDVEVLTNLSRKHPIPSLILEYRQLAKLKGTYVDGMLTLIDPKTQRIHTTFNQTVTTTGRISSTEPNLQNIPIRSETGREIRKAFTAGTKGWKILAADYSQIELRVLAHLCGDETLRESFFKDEDIHTRTASEVFGVPLNQVTPELRGKAKAVNFGIIYGISDYGLSVNLKITREEAKSYIENYFAQYPKVQEYMDRTIKEARENGYVATIFKRRRYLPDLHSRNYTIRSFAERTAMNTPIQGSAADIIKMAMVHVQKRMEKEKLKARMLLQVHDELIFEAPPEELDQLSRLVTEEMENAFPMAVPLKVDVGIGPNWYDVKKA